MYSQPIIEAQDKRIPKHNNYYSIRLSLRRRYEQGRSDKERLIKFINKVKETYFINFIFSIIHKGRKKDHFHILIATTSEITKQGINEIWRHHCPVKQGYTGYHTNLKAVNNYYKELLYLFYGKREKPRMRQAWGNYKVRRTKYGVY